MKLSNLSVKNETSSVDDTILVLTASGDAHRITMGNVIDAVYSSDTFRNSLIESLVGSDYFQNQSKAAVIAVLEQLNEIPAGATQSFLQFISAAQNGDQEAVAPSSTLVVGPNLTLVVE